MLNRIKATLRELKLLELTQRSSIVPCRFESDALRYVLVGVPSRATLSSANRAARVDDPGAVAVAAESAAEGLGSLLSAVRHPARAVLVGEEGEAAGFAASATAAPATTAPATAASAAGAAALRVVCLIPCIKGAAVGERSSCSVILATSAESFFACALSATESFSFFLARACSRPPSWLLTCHMTARKRLST